MARMDPASAIPPKEPVLMTVKHYDHTIIDHTDVPTNPIPQHVRIDTSDSKTARTDRTGIRAGSPPEGAVLIVERGPDVGSRFLLAQPVTSVGRHPRSDVFLDEVTVSRHHAELRWTNSGLRVVDLGSLNGTYVNGEAVESAVLVHGDELQCGKFQLTFWLHPDSTEAANIDRRSDDG
jgi:pSer/pThr/pTyr-binding forkhead associated (FHA) protein